MKHLVQDTREHVERVNKENGLSVSSIETERSEATNYQTMQEITTLAGQMQAVFGAMADYVIVFDVRGCLIHANASAIALFELGAPEQFIGMSYYQFPHLYQVWSATGEQLTMPQLPMSRILRGEVLASTTAEEIHVRLPSQREVQLHVFGGPVQNLAGAVIGGLCMFRDVTRQRQQERRTLQTLNALLSQMEELAHLPEHMDRLPEEGAEALVLPIDVVGQRLADLIKEVMACQHVIIATLEPPDDQVRIVAASGVTPEQEQSYNEGPEPSWLPDYLDRGTIGHLRSHEAVIRDLEGLPLEQRVDLETPNMLLAPLFLDKKLFGIFVVTKANGVYEQDEIELVQAVANLVILVIERVRLLNEWAKARASEMALQEINTRFDTFLSIASHELRTPLTSIVGHVQLALRRLEKLKLQGVEQVETVLGKLDNIQNSLGYAVAQGDVQNRMIGDLLDASRIRANRLNLMKRPVDLVDIVRNSVEDQRRTTPDRVITLHLPANKKIHLLADPDRIGQVVHNYLSNAIKYSPAERPVEVRVERAGEMALVSVRDEGPGLSPEDQARVWGRFYRVKGIEVRYGGGAGLGLGLYICRTLIEQHHGQVGINSAPGKGSTFWFKLPLSSP